MKILKKPDVFLRQETYDVEFPLHVNSKRLIADMIQTMYENNGIGLAANQVGYNRRIFIMDTTPEKNKPQVFINPVIISKNNIKMGDLEG